MSDTQTTDDSAPELNDSSNTPRSERETEVLQDDQQDSPALHDPAIDADDVVNLPGTGGPDDGGDIEVDPGELHVPRHTGITAAAPPQE